MSLFDCSLVISVYERPDYLRYMLAAYARQSYRAFEILVADDGSGPEIAAVIDDAHGCYGLNIRHLWHEERGWRKNVMLNNAIRHARSAYMIFTDGDCIPHKHFVADHMAEKEQGYYLCGRRLEAGEKWTRALDLKAITSGRYEQLDSILVWEGVTGQARRLEERVRFQRPILRRLLHNTRSGMLGSNFSVHRAALEAINGFDEEYVGPGYGEDSDVELRLSLCGLRPKILRHWAIQYHLYHPRTVAFEGSRDRFAALQREPRMQCVQGLDHIHDRMENTLT